MDTEAMMATTVEILQAARAKIERAEHWTKGAAARTSYRGNPIGPKTSGAICWCTLGAISAVTDTAADANAALLALAEAAGIYVEFIPDWNDDDGTRHEHVIAAFDRAIAKAKETA
jgi:hypothetical protein